MSGMAEARMRKIRALLAQAEDPGATPEEAKTFSAKAFDLMAEHGIEMAMLEAHNDAQNAQFKPTRRVFQVDPPWALNGARLLNQLANALRCRAVRLTDHNKIVILEVFGFDSDLDRLDILYTSLLLQMHAGLQTAQARKPDHEHGRAFNQSWMLGFISTVSLRVETAERKAAEENNNNNNNRTEHTENSTAIVLADRISQVESAFNEAYPRTTKGSKNSSKGSGYSLGAEAGKKADIGQNRITGKTSIER